MKESVVYTGGTFDLFHTGHVSFLRRCAELGQVVVAVNTDEFVAAFKGRKPVQSLEERMSVLRSCKYVSAVVVNTGGGDSKPSIQCVKPDLLVVGSDWSPPKDYFAQLSVTQEWLDTMGIKLIFLDYTKGVSSTIIRSRL